MKGGEIARRLLVDQRKGIIQFRLPVGRAVLLEGRAIGIGHGNGKGADRRRAIAPAAMAIGGGRGRGRHAMPGLGKAHHLPAAGHQLGHAQRRLIGFAARRQQHGALQPAGASRASSAASSTTGRVSMPENR